MNKTIVMKKIIMSLFLATSIATFSCENAEQKKENAQVESAEREENLEEEKAKNNLEEAADSLENKSENAADKADVLKEEAKEVGKENH